MAFLTGDAIELSALLARVQSPSRGGVAVFLGQVRDHQDGRAVARLEYSAYGPMAEAERRWNVAVALAHRTGSLAIGDLAVAVVAASAHRADAFTACRFVIEELKRRVPIWKREQYADGTIAWVDPTATLQHA